MNRAGIYLRTGLASLALLAGCSGVPSDLGLEEPLRARGARFVAEPLPGLSPDDPTAATPAITLVENANPVVRLGQVDKALSGRAATDAAAVALAFDGVGGGYWVQPLGPRDPTAGNELTWAFDLSFGWDLPLGNGAIDVVAVDADGNAGRQERVALCVRPDLLDNDATCSQDAAPPEAVLALAWDTEVDLDLWLVTPDGKRVDASHPTTIGHVPPITQADLSSPGVGVLDRDSNGGCVIDGINREAIVWKTPPNAGTYLVYANLTDACGHASVRFSATLYRPDGSQLVEVSHQDGRLLAGAANGGRGPGLYLMQLAL